MKRTVSILLIMLLALTSFGVSAAEGESADTPAKQVFTRYIKDIYGSAEYMNYEPLGRIGNNTYAYGAYAEATDTFYTAVLGDYIFSKSYIATPYKLGLYIITDNTVYPLESAYSLGIIKDEDLPTVASLTQRVGVRKMSYEEKAVYKHINDKGLFTSSNYSYNYIGSLGGGLRGVAQVQTNDLNYSEVIGEYRVYSDPEPWHFAMGTQLFIVGDLELNENAVWSLKDACDEGIVTIEEVKELCDSKYVNGVYFEPAVEPDSSEVALSEMSSSENASSEPTHTKTTDNPIKRAVMEQYGIDNPENITVSYNHKLSNGMSLVYYSIKDELLEAWVHYDWIGKYIYTYYYTGWDYKLFDGVRIISLKTAYQNGIIGSAELKEISSELKDMKVYKKTLKAGETSYVENDFVDSFKVSDSKVLKIDNDDGTIYGLTKGTATVTAKIGGKACTCKVKVTTNPTLTRNGKTVKSVTVKKGKTVKIRINGKVKSITNKYKSTEYAIILGKKSAEVIKIKGVKKGTTNLKISVNGKKLGLKVNVK